MMSLRIATEVTHDTVVGILHKHYKNSKSRTY